MGVRLRSKYTHLEDIYVASSLTISESLREIPKGQRQDASKRLSICRGYTKHWTVYQTILTADKVNESIWATDHTMAESPLQRYRIFCISEKLCKNIQTRY